MKKICRLCLQAQRDMIHLFSDGIDNDECLQIRLQIADLCSIVISQDDNLPKFICCECKAKLQDAHEFINLCKCSNNKLLEHYEKSKLCQIRNVISLKEKKQKLIKEKKHKCTNKSLKSIKKSLQPEISMDLDTYNPALTINIHNENIEEKTSISNSANEKILNSKNQETFLKKGKVLNSNVSCNQVTENSEKQYLCDICSKTFASMSGLRFHLKSHYGSKPHACQYCGKSFAIPSYKKRHEKTHTGDKRFVCHICSTAFASSNGLKYHLRTHTGEANYHCGTCGKSFARYKYLKEHVYTHTGEKPFVCKLCGSAYGNSGSLFVHEKKCKSRHAFDFPKDVSKTAVTLMV